MRRLLEDIADASPHVTIVEQDDSDGFATNEGGAGVRRPSFAIHRPGETPRVRFAGLPLGHEFTSLVLALLHVGRHPPKVDDQVLARVEGLAGPLHFETYFSQSCQNCPDVVQALNLMAARNPNVTHIAIDGATFHHEVEKRQVMAVPTDGCAAGVYRRRGERGFPRSATPGVLPHRRPPPRPLRLSRRPPPGRRPRVSACRAARWGPSAGWR